MRRPLARRALLAVLPLLGLSAVACSSSSAPAAAEPSPKTTTPLGGGFDGLLEGDSRFSVVASDGRVLLDGLPPATVEEDAPPLVGFAVRDAKTTFEMQAGAFKPTEADQGPWRVASHLVVTSSGATPSFEATDDAGQVLAHVAFSAPETGHLVADVTPGDGPEQRFSWGFACDADDHFAGFGAQTWDVDHRGFTVPTWVQEEGIGKVKDDSYSGVWQIVGRRHSSQLPIPEYLSRRGYVLVAETDLRASFALCSEADTAARLELELPVKVHIFDGPGPKDALLRASATFGRPRMPPKTAFAPWNDAVFGSASVRDVAARLRQYHVPSGAIWTEDWRGGDWKGTSYSLKEEWEVDSTLYPDFPKLADDLHAQGFRFFVYFNPFVYKGSKAWSQTQPNGWLIKHEDGTDYTFTGAKFTDTSLIDLDNPGARGWVKQKLGDAIALGADGWMCDFAEWLPTDAVTAAGPALPRHNTYPVAWQKAHREALDAVNDGQERLFFARSGWLGTPPLADVVWAGDQRTDFEEDDGLPTILPIGIGLGVVGVSTYGHDIAGYQSATNDPSTQELFFRWTELGAWSPVMRTHHGTAPKLEWSWDKDAATIAHYARYAKLHMSLFPYLEALAANAEATGTPMWRGMMLEFPDDPYVWPIKDQVMLGDGVLVAPIQKKGATTRITYLPAGLWYPWWGGPPFEGGGTIESTAQLTEIPIYLRSGTVLPMLPDGVMTAVGGSADVPDVASVGDARVLYAFLGASGSFTEASGLSYAIEHLAESPVGDASYTWRGEALTACNPSAPVRPCMDAGYLGVPLARVSGYGTLEVKVSQTPVARITAAGRPRMLPLPRDLDIVVRR